MDMNEDLLLWFINFLIKSPQAVVLIQHQRLMNNQLNNYTNQLLKELKKRKVDSGFRDNRGADLADMQLISKFNKELRFLLCVIDIFSEYAWVVLFKDKKDVSIVNVFQKILKESDRKSNKIQIDKGSKFYNNSFKNG